MNELDTARFISWNYLIGFGISQLAGLMNVPREEIIQMLLHVEHEKNNPTNEMRTLN